MDLLTNQRMADQISGIYQDLEERLMQNIVKHCKTYDQPIASDVWLARKLAETENTTKNIFRLLHRKAASLKQLWSACWRTQPKRRLQKWIPE